MIFCFHSCKLGHETYLFSLAYTHIHTHHTIHFPKHFSNFAVDNVSHGERPCRRVLDFLFICWSFLPLHLFLFSSFPLLSVVTTITTTSFLIWSRPELPHNQTFWNSPHLFFLTFSTCHCIKIHTVPFLEVLISGIINCCQSSPFPC